MKKTVFIMMLMVLLAGALAACQPQTIIETVEVEKIVEVEKEVEVEKIVEVEKEVEVMVEADRPVVIGFAAPSLVAGQLDIQNSFIQAAQVKGWQVVTTNANGDSQKQLNDIEFLLTSGVDAIVSVPNDSQAICSAAESAKEAGVPFYTIDRAPIGCAIEMIVQSDNRLGGQQAGQAVIDFLTEKNGSPMGKVLEVTGDLGQNVGVLRRDGFHDIVDTYADVEVIQKVGNWDAAIGQQAVLDVATANPDLDAIYYHSDFVYTAGTIEALSQLGMMFKAGEEGHIFIASIDGGPFGLEAIRNGDADFAATQPVPDFGIICNWIEMKLNGEEYTLGEVTQEGALWSPANVFLNDDGTYELFLSTIATTIDNVDEPTLWGNAGF